MEDKLKDLVLVSAKRQELTREDINEQTDLVDDLEFDSISFVKLVVDIENLFGIEFDDDMLDYEILTSYGKLWEYVRQALSAEGSTNG